MLSESQPIAQPPAYIERRGSGTPVILLHGWGASSALFHATIAGLEHAFALIVPDLPGFGRTPPPPGAWSVSDYTIWLVHLLDGLAIKRAHIVGHSFGGRIAIKLASAYPERVEKLVLTDSAGIRPQRTLRYWLRVRTFKTIRRLSHAAIAPGPVRTWAAARVATSGSSDYRLASGTVRSSFVRIVNEDLQSYLPRIQAPTLLVWGENDTDTPPADGRLMERLIPDAGLVVFEGAGHYAYLEQSARFCRILETFFRGTS
ncbi:MAG TPA: alpha/beta hydrolase [Ktedonobacteraceae bacterium]